MERMQDGGRRWLTVLLFFGALLACSTRALHAQSPASLDKDEVIEKVDPYTKGEDAALDKAGYISFGPFLFADKIRTQDVEEALGGIRVLWVETAHFKIGSTLRSYKLGADPREDKKIEDELKRLKTKFARPIAVKNKLDPWLRLHLFALRLEEQYADFCQRFGVRAEDFDPKTKVDGAPFMGDGPFLGMEMKFTLLLADRQSSVARFLKQFCNVETPSWQRWTLPGQSLFLGISAEILKEFGYERDSDLHATVASEVAMNFVDGFRKASQDAPFWFKAGLAHDYARRVDERCVLAAVGTHHGDRNDDDSRWEPRVCGLVFNKAATAWKDTFAWSRWEDLKSQGHLIAWSRVSWLLSRKNTDLHALLMALTERSPPELSDAEKSKAYVERQIAAFQSVLGKTPEAADADWRQFVLKNYPKK